MNTLPKRLTVIVCTHNRQEYILDCIKSLIDQDYDRNDYSILIVDNASNDKTPEIVAELVKSYDHTFIRVIQEDKIGLSHARNRGLSETSTPYIAFIDDDARVTKNWISTAKAIIEKYQPDIFGGPAYPIFPSGKPEWFKDEYGVRGDMGETGFITKGFIVGTNIFFRRELLIEYGGFDPELGMKGNRIGYHEETRLVNRAFNEARKVFYSKELYVHDCIPDFKRSLAFYIYARYKSGRDRITLEPETAVETDPFELIKRVDELFQEFDYALMKRDTEKFQFPENYIIEKMRHKFVDLGKHIGSFLRKQQKKQ